jgi:hypothetical protein
MFQRLHRWPLFGLSLLFALCLVLSPALASGPRQEEYPPPQATIDPLTGEPLLLPTPTLAGYPGQPGIGAATPVPIGIDGAGQLPVAPPGETSAAPASPGRGLLYLWLGFIATLLILLTSVIGSIRLFTRRNES